MNHIDKNKPTIMGILNVTPDSFSDGGSYPSSSDAVNRAMIMIEQGAKIIDIGGESTRPGSERVSALEQIRRISDVISQVCKEKPSDIIVSVDTTLAEVAKVAIDSGAELINDVSGGNDDSTNMLDLVKDSKCYYCIMHMKGIPKTMQNNPQYSNVVSEVLDFLKAKASVAQEHGIEKEKIILDPGIGFGKTLEHNLDLLANLHIFANQDYHTLLGTSRKKLFDSILNIVSPDERVIGTCATSVVGVNAGINIFRVHDVWQNKQAIDVAYEIKKLKFFIFKLKLKLTLKNLFFLKI